MDIRILPSNIANMIAAGEVVQRPASVVKELMENAVDAGADTVSVTVQDAGRTLIQVTDNGCGIGREDIRTAFLRHATSKLSTAEDLQSFKIGDPLFRVFAVCIICSIANYVITINFTDIVDVFPECHPTLYMY